MWRSERHSESSELAGGGKTGGARAKALCAGSVGVAALLDNDPWAVMWLTVAQCCNCQSFASCRSLLKLV